MGISYLHEPTDFISHLALLLDFDFIRIDDMQSPNESVFKLIESKTKHKNESNRIEAKRTKVNLQVISIDTM